MRIRDARLEDLGAVARIEGWAIENTPASFLPAARDEADWRGRFGERDAKYPWVVAEVDEAVVGFAVATRYRARQAYDWTVEVSAYVDASHHRKGIGRALYTELLSRLTDAGFHLAVAVVVTPNPASERLHETLGFRRIGTIHEVGWKHGAWRDTTYFEKRLSEGPPR